jgi:hypothetical protein
MTSVAATHRFVCGVFDSSPDVARLDGINSPNLIVDGLKTPKATACEGGDFSSGLIRS